MAGILDAITKFYLSVYARWQYFKYDTYYSTAFNPEEFAKGRVTVLIKENPEPEAVEATEKKTIS